MDELNYSSEIMEPFAIKQLIKFIDKSYTNFNYHDKKDNFDYTNDNPSIALEISTLISKNSKDVLEYERAHNKGKICHKKISKYINLNSAGDVEFYLDGDMDEIRNEAIQRIYEKNQKAIKRSIKFESYELCLLIPDGGLFNSLQSFGDIFDNIWDHIVFSTVYIITSSSLFIYKKDFRKVIKRN